MPAVHVRRQIREAVATALTGLSTTGARVSQARMAPRRASDLPCLLVETADERIEQTAQSRLTRELTVIVRCFAKANTALDDTLDQIAGEVETALAAAGTLGGLVPGGVTPVQASIDFDDTLEQPAGVLVMEYRAVYFGALGSPNTVI